MDQKEGGTQKTYKQHDWGEAPVLHSRVIQWWSHGFRFQANMPKLRKFQCWKFPYILVKRITKSKIKNSTGISFHKAVQYARHQKVLQTCKRNRKEHKFWNGHFRHQLKITKKVFTSENLGKYKWLRDMKIPTWIDIQRNETKEKMRERYGQQVCLESKFPCVIYHFLDAKCGVLILKRESCVPYILIQGAIADKLNRKKSLETIIEVENVGLEKIGKTVSKSMNLLEPETRE